VLFRVVSWIVFSQTNTIHEITRTNTKKELILVSFGTHEIADQAMQIEGVFWTDQAKSV